MKILKIYLSALAILIFLVSESKAAHIIGGEVVYKCISSDAMKQITSFEISFTMYRDSKGNGAQFDLGADFGLYKSSDGQNWSHIRTYKADPENKDDVDYDNPCIIVPPNVGVEKATYTFTVDIEWGTGIYQIAYQRCCRNETITNIVDPGSTGAAFSVEIFADAISTCNNSPVFKNFPPIVICNGEPLRFDHSAIDGEGDQLVYEFCAPLQSGGRDGQNPGEDASSCTGVKPAPSRCSPPFKEVLFKVPEYSSVNPLSGSPEITIDPLTGIITGIPNVIGQFVVGVCVKEFRNGKQIGSIRRDFQFNVTNCQIAVDAIIEPDHAKISNGYVELEIVNELFKFRSCGSNYIPFINKSVQERNIKAYKWKIETNGKIDSFTTKDIEYTFNEYGIYKGLMILNPDLSDCSDTANIEVEILPPVKADFSYRYDTCVAGPITFTDNSIPGSGVIQAWSWEFENDESSTDQNPLYEYRTPGTKKVMLTSVDSKLCRNTIEKDIIYLPVPALLVVEPTQFTGCVPASIFFNNLSYPIDESYVLEWDFGDGKKSNKISPTHVFEKTGIYDVSLKITSPIGCTTFSTYPQWIDVLESADAAFTYSPEKFNNFNKTANFFSNSLRAKSLFWDFSGRGNSFAENPTFTFPDTGFYQIVLLAIHENGCTDTAFAFIDVTPLVSLEMPNAFTPNNDGLNDSFKGFGYLDGLTNYKMTVWNRWGEQIFVTNDPLNGWNGEKNNNGLLSPQGVYVYLIDYLTPRGEVKNLKGHVTLIR